MVSCIVSVCGQSTGGHGLISIILQLKNQTYESKEIIPVVCCVENVSFIQSIVDIDLHTFSHEFFTKTHEDAFYLKNNLGMNIAKGEYAGFFSGDDYYDKNYLSKMISNLVLQNATLIYCNFKSHYGQYAYVEGDIMEGHITSGNFIVKSKIFKKLGGFQTIPMGDFDLANRVKEAGFKTVRLDEMLYIHN